MEAQTSIFKGCTYPLYPACVASPAAAFAIALAMYCGMGSVVSPMPRLIILASGICSWRARRLRAISGKRYPAWSLEKLELRCTRVFAQAIVRRSRGRRDGNVEGRRLKIISRTECGSIGKST